MKQRAEGNAPNCLCSGVFEANDHSNDIYVNLAICLTGFMSMWKLVFVKPRTRLSQRHPGQQDGKS